MNYKFFIIIRSGFVPYENKVISSIQVPSSRTGMLDPLKACRIIKMMKIDYILVLF